MNIQETLDYAEHKKAMEPKISHHKHYFFFQGLINSGLIDVVNECVKTIEIING